MFLLCSVRLQWKSASRKEILFTSSCFVANLPCATLTFSATLIDKALTEALIYSSCGDVTRLPYGSKVPLSSLQHVHVSPSSVAAPVPSLCLMRQVGALCDLQASPPLQTSSGLHIDTSARHVVQHALDCTDQPGRDLVLPRVPEGDPGYSTGSGARH
jgi:hypothetical protein